MKISLLFPYPLQLDGNNGGGANATLALVSGSVQRGHSVDAYLLGEPRPSQVRDGVTFRWLGSEPRKVSVSSDLFVVVLFDDRRSVLKRFQLSRATCRAVVYHNAIFEDSNKPLMRFYRNWPDAFFVVSDYPAQQARRLGIGYIGVLRNQVAPVFRRRVPTRLPSPDRTFVFVGALVKDKGVAYLLSAFVQLAARFPDARLRIVGSARLWSRDQPDFELVMHPNVEYRGELGPVELGAVYEESAFVVLPSEMESCGLSVLDGMWFGCIPIVSNRGGLPENVVDGENGFVLSELTSECLLSNLVKASELTNEEFVRMQQRCLARVSRSDWTDSAVGLETVRPRKRGLPWLWR